MNKKTEIVDIVLFVMAAATFTVSVAGITWPLLTMFDKIAIIVAVVVGVGALIHVGWVAWRDRK